MARHFRSRHMTVISPIHQMALSRPVAHAAACSHQLCHCKPSDWQWGPSSYMGYPPSCAPDGVGRKPCRQGPPSMRPDGAGVVKAAEAGTYDNEDNSDDKEDDGTSTDKWVSGSGMPGSFCLASWGPLGLWRRWFLCWGTTGGRCFSHGLFLILESSQFL
jgi:hypothetical protein